MSKTKSIFLVLSKVVIISFYGLTAQISNDNLLAYYPFNGDVLDYSQNEFHGSLMGGVFVEDRAGVSQNALRFDGTNDFLNLNLLAETFNNNLDELTIYFLIKFNGTLKDQAIISLGYQGENIDTNVFEIEFENNQFQIESETGSNAINHELELDQAMNLIDNNWHEILIKIKNDSISYCRDNLLIYKGKFIPSETTASILNVGCFDGDDSNFSCCFFSGVIDDLQIYKTLDLQFKSDIRYEGCESGNYSLEINSVIYDINNAKGSELVKSNCCLDTLFEIDLTFYDDYFLNINEQHCINSNYNLEVNNVVYNIDNPFGVEILKSINQCDSIINISLEFSNFIEIDIFENFCQGDTISYLINGNLYNENNPFGQEIILGSIGCDTMINIDLEYYPNENAEFNFTGCENDTFSIEINGTRYNKYNPIGEEVLQSAFGCDSIVFIELDYSLIDCEVYFPNVIYPLSKNKLNNVFYPLYNDDCNVEILSFLIFDRWGNLIFDNVENSWDAKFRNTDVSQGVYFYLTKFESDCGFFTKTGTISVIK